MTPEQLTNLPPWGNQLLWSLITLLSAYLMGQFITRRATKKKELPFHSRVGLFTSPVLASPPRHR